MKNAYLLGILAVCLTACNGGKKDDNIAQEITTNAGNNSSTANNNAGNNSSTANNNAGNNSSTVNNNAGNNDSTANNNAGNNSSTANNNAENNSSTVNNNAGNNSSTANNNAGNNDSTDNSNTSKIKTPILNEPINLDVENLKTKEYQGGLNISYGRLKLVEDNVYLSPQIGTQNTEETYVVKPMTESQKQSAQVIVDYTNQLRAAQGLPALELDDSLTAFAQHRAAELVGRYSHTRPDGTGYNSGLSGRSGENIASGYTTALAVSQGWENSPGHYANMVTPDFTKIGIGVLSVPGSENTYQWVQIFGNDTTETKYHFDETASSQSDLFDVTAKLQGVKPAIKWLSLENGTAIYISDVEPNGSWYNFSQTKGDKTENVLVNGYDDIRFGVLQEQNGVHQIFYRGENTAFENIPTEGTINYAGKAIMTDGNNPRFLNSAFQANFADKKLDGVLSEQGNSVLDIHAVIRGSSFYSNADAQVETQGGFFGDKAEEMGGVFYDHNSEQYGAFGAKQK